MRASPGVTRSGRTGGREWHRGVGVKVEEWRSNRFFHPSAKSMNAWLFFSMQRRYGNGRDAAIGDSPHPSQSSSGRVKVGPTRAASWWRLAMPSLVKMFDMWVSSVLTEISRRCEVSRYV